MFGVHGRVLHLDLERVLAKSVEIPDDVNRAFLGGIGLGTYLLNEWCPPGTDPLAPEAPLIFASSPFIGTGITTASKLVILARSPQTGFIGDSLTSSYLALSLKRTGYDGLIITGALDQWSTLVIENDTIRVEPACKLLGRSPIETGDLLRTQLGRDFRVAAIGVAGERGVRFAAISNDGRLAGRTGTGSVMGSKRLKAIALRGTRGLPPVADPGALARRARALARRSLGPETAKYRELGTAANLSFFNRMDILPTRNFQSGHVEDPGAISGETLYAERRADKHACAACTIGCEHHYYFKERAGTNGAFGNGTPGRKKGRLEYESLFALGPLCGINDPDVVLSAAARCDELGMDAISTGATIAWAMECVEQGIDLGFPTDQLPRFGEAGSVLHAIDAIARREGAGDLLAGGSRHAARHVGQGSEAWAMQVKGLEMPGYHPGKLPTLALGLAVATRGACHNRSSAYEVDLSDQLPASVEARLRAEAAIDAEDRATLLDSLTVCKFLRHCFDDLPAEAAELYGHVTGEHLSRADMLRAGERINNLKKLFNIRHGWTADDDWLPARAFASDSGPGTLDPRVLRDLIDAYYSARGWRSDGTISAEHLNALGLAQLVTAR
jgi:aldehyde:ferredoxin oxidoreductase